MLISKLRAFSKMIVKPLLDQREYRHVQLPNKLEALLISDPSADKAAAAMDVRVGSLFDPPRYQGLAHFLEHMLFLGTAKYPEEDAYQSYLAQHGGLSNAFTADNHTCYFFSVAPDHLEGALDRFGQFFISPSFTQGATDREVNAVHSEHSKNLQEDMWRQYQLMREKLFNEKHPSHHFSTGNKETLGSVPRSVLLDFHKAWYSANVSRVAVLGKENLDDLEAVVRKIFSDVPNKDVVVPLGDEFGSESFLRAIADPAGADTTTLSYPTDFPIPHIDSACLGKQLYVVPVKEQRSIQFGWFLPEQRTLWESKPAKYLSHIFGHEGEGSLTQVLKSKGIATDLVSGLYYDCAGIALFKIDIHLTKSAADQLAGDTSPLMEDLATIVSSYIRLAKEKQSKELWDEVERVENLGFTFRATTDPMNTVQTVVNAMHYYPVSEVLAGPTKIYQYDPETIQAQLAALSGDRFFTTLIGKEFSKKCDSTEKWYGTQYGWTDVDQGVIQKWGSIESMSSKKFASVCESHGLAMPEPNPFLPSDLSVLSVPESVRNLTAPTQLNPGLFFKQDNKFKMPKAHAAFVAYSSFVQQGVDSFVATDLFLQCFTEDFSKIAYMADIAGLKCKVRATTEGVQISLGGYSGKLSILAGQVIERLNSFTPNAAQFDLVKDRLVRSLQSQLLQRPAYNQAMDLVSQLIIQPQYPTGVKLARVQKTTLADVVGVRDSIFKSVMIESLVEGNFSESDAIRINAEIAKLATDATKNRSVGNVKVMNIPHDIIISRQGVNPNETNGAVAVSVQAGWLAATDDETDLPLAAKLNVVSQISGQKFFDDLRTKQQLGYIVHAAAMVQERRAGLLFLVQSEVPTAEVREKVFTFINSLADQVEAIPAEDFQKYVEAVITDYKEKPKNQSEEFQRHWAEIEKRRFAFTRRDKLVPVTEKLTQAEVVAFIRESVVNAPKVVAIVTGSNEPESTPVMTDDEIVALRSQSTTQWTVSNTQPCKPDQSVTKGDVGMSRI
jgi:insulysin